MHNGWPVYIAIVLWIWTCQGHAAQDTTVCQNTKIFLCAWCEIRYPANFTVRPSMPSTTAEGYDSAEFIAPDASVSFYIFAPQWGGEARDIALDTQREILVSTQSRRKSGVTRHWFTIAAKDGSYRRSYLDTIEQQGSVRHVIGMKYRNEAVRRSYLKAYACFRQSLKHFTD